MKKVLLFILLTITQLAQAQVFTKSNQDFHGVYGGGASFGDVDGDGDQDFIVTGADNPNDWVTVLYKNDGNGNFTKSSHTFSSSFQGPVEFGDVNGDGYDDLVMTGLGPHAKLGKLYINDGEGNFTDVTVPFAPVYNGSLNIIDVNNDHHMDVYLSGLGENGFVADLYINTGNGENGFPNFVRSHSKISPTYFSTSDWKDFNEDGFLDLLITGTDFLSRYSQIYLNDGKGTMILDDRNLELLPVHGGSGIFVDLNNDKHLDVILSGGDPGNVNLTRIYMNDGTGILVPSKHWILPDMRAVMMTYDLDGDGLMNIFMVGPLDNQLSSHIYEPIPDGGFTVSKNPFQPLNIPATIDLGNVDGDANPELLITGQIGGEVGRFTYLYNVSSCPPKYSTDSQEHCGSYTWRNGKTYTESNNTATYNLTSVEGCDSIITLDLTILKPSASTETVVACSNYTWRDGVTYTNSNNSATVTLENSSGCDSVITLDLTITRLTGTHEVNACGSYTWIDGVTYTDDTETAVDTVQTSEGCDSIVTLHLSITRLKGTDVVNACGAYTWIDGITYKESNFRAVDTVLTKEGCDSIVTLNLTMHSPAAHTDEIISCGPYTWIDGITYTKSNNAATHTLETIYGCDSVVSLNLIVSGPTVRIMQVSSKCEPYYVSPSGKYIWTESGDYWDTISNQYGCDSVLLVSLSIDTSRHRTLDFVTCGKFIAPDGTIIRQGGTYTVIIPTMAGCDSVITVHLTVIPNDNSVTVQGNTITVNQQGAHYRWINCTTGKLIDGAIEASFTPGENGTYAALITYEGCRDTSECISIATIGIDNNNNLAAVNLYPNPTNGGVTISLGAVRTVSIVLRDVSGRMLRTSTFEGISSVDYEMAEESGIYFLHISDAAGSEKVIKVIRQ